ncbi:MAG: protein kinase [Deltaproteobacteria bacterium]|nr:protein kinase [Deltaproteobacteria bacterium]
MYVARVTGPGGFVRHVVVKTLPEERSDDAAFVSMFLDEARLVATLHHQHIAQVFEVGRAENGTYFLAMEYVHGETVRHVLEAATKRRKQLPIDLGLSVTCAAAAGLHHAHERRDVDGTPLGIVHRDVSPSNVMLGFDGSIKLIDFGIAKARLRSTQTAIGHVKGKLGYMAPEQARGEAVDRRSDVFALGVLAYEMTTQTRAFHGPSEFETMRRTFHGELEPPSRRLAGYPPALEDIVMTALATDPADRFQDSDAMRFALEQVARELGATLGDDPVIRTLDRLFPPRPEPWFTAAQEHEQDDTTAAASISEPQIVISHSTPTTGRLARGTADPSPKEASELEHLRAELLAIPDPVPAPDTRELTTRPFERTASPVVDPMLAAAATAPIHTARARARRTAVRTAASPILPLELPLPSPPLPLPAVDELRLEPPQPAPSAAPRFDATQHVGGRARVLGFAIAGAIVAAALVVGAIAFQRESPPAPATSTPPVAAVPRPPAPVAPVSAPPPVEHAAPHVSVLLNVSSKPVGATVVLDGVRLGVTPYTGPVAIKPTGAWLKVRKHGYVAVKTRVSLERDVHWDVELRPLSR